MNDFCLYCFGKRGTEPGAFDQPVDLTMNNNEDWLYIIADTNNCRIQLFKDNSSKYSAILLVCTMSKWGSLHTC